MELTDMTRFKHKRQAGFSLLEALIALFVFSIALLGLAGMYTKTLSLSHSSYLRALASIHATDMKERIRANPGAAQGTFGDITEDDYHFDAACNNGDFVAVTPAFTNPSAPADVAAFDRAAWCAQLGDAFGALISSANVTAARGPLPKAEAEYKSSDIVPVVYTIEIVWDERALDDENNQVIEQQTFTYRVRR